METKPIPKKDLEITIAQQVNRIKELELSLEVAENDTIQIIGQRDKLEEHVKKLESGISHLKQQLELAESIIRNISTTVDIAVTNALQLGSFAGLKVGGAR